MKSQKNSQQLEIFPLQPGTNPARPAAGPGRKNFPGRASCQRFSARSENCQELLDTAGREPLGSQRLDPNQPTEPVARWRVAQQAWQAVERFRARRDGVAMTFQQGLAAVICQPAADENPEQLNPWEQVLAAAGFVVVLALVISAI